MPTHAITDNPFGDTQVAVYGRKTVLTDAQIKALPTTPVELVPAPGAGKQVLLVAATASIDASGGAYTNVDGSGNSYLYVGTDYFISDPINPGFWGDAVTKAINLTPSGYINTMFSPRSDIENKPINFIMDNAGVGDLTGGDASNTATITVLYSIIDL